MSTLRGWWEEDKEQTQRYYNTLLKHNGTAPLSATPEICKEIVNGLNAKYIPTTKKVIN
jgi:4-alpha-glucanotransferase